MDRATRMNGLVDSRLSKRKLFVLFFVALLILLGIYAVYYVSTVSYITISLEDPENSSVTIANQNTDMDKLLSLKSQDTKVRVKKGSYEVYYQSPKGTFFEIVNTKGFLATTTVLINEQPQRKRIFIGDNPKPCMEYTTVLVSYGCGGPFEQVLTHVPATRTVPTYTVRDNSSPVSTGDVADIFTYKGKSTALLLAPSLNEGPSIYGFWELSFMPNAPTEKILVATLPELSTLKQYSVSSYMEGVMISSFDLAEAYYYSSLVDDTPKKINIPEFSNNKYSPTKISSRVDSYAVLYNNIDIPYDRSKGSAEGSGLIIQQDTEVISKSYNKTYSELSFCGLQTICLLDYEGVMDIFSITEDGEIDFSYSLSNVTSVSPISDNMVIVANKQTVLLLNITSKTGYTIIDSGEYGFGKTKVVNNSLVLVTTNNNTGSSALLVSLDKPNTDSIDKKINSLAENTFIKKVSAYKNFIYISPNLGDLIFVNGTNSLGYNQKTIEQAKKSISQLLLEVELVPSNYTVSSPLIGL